MKLVSEGSVRRSPAMRILDHLPRTGEFLFRWRSYLPLLLIPMFLGSFIGATYPFDSHAVDLAWELGCFFFSMTGLALRGYVVGTAPRGTSGRNTRAQKALLLRTTGPYSVVRHPLYVANALIALGMASFSRTWFLPVIVTLAALVYYERIATREEKFLEERFGDEFRRWVTRVPAMVPTFSSYEPSASPFVWRKAVRQECFGVAIVGGSFFLMELVQDLAVNGRLMLDPVWTVIFVLSMLLFTVTWILRKRGLLTPDGRSERSASPGLTA